MRSACILPTEPEITPKSHLSLDVICETEQRCQENKWELDCFVGTTFVNTQLVNQVYSCS